ncbi:DNA-processing protein DprA [Citricoccus sp. K5]|uniref:DNA-processing protein DprA n=1 Tax=Citricoccus sp. K5 TaxID=2653135 RepID=UPI0012F15784|nr:DNA-processing protein DprA [Citricoccus sp. K5]VXB21606.1 DNA processing protein [Citricoccus sp. K5]
MNGTRGDGYAMTGEDMSGTTIPAGATGELRIARAALTRLLEPGSVLGATAVRVWGASRAVQILTGRDTPGADERQDLRLVLASEGVTLTERTWTTSLAGWAARASSLAPERDLASLERLGGGLLIPEDPGWPSGVDDLGPAAPVALWFRGAGPVPRGSSTLAVVGSRDATGYGQSVTRNLAGGLAARGLTVMSGGAYGIDAMAHRAALASGTGMPPTVAVMAGGLDRYYPAGNEDLLREVVAQGLLLSELPPGASPTRHRFLQRNRIIAALSAAVLVVEARWRSGAQNTAGHALGLGREVGVVPGPVTSPQSAGCHRLLRESPAVVVSDVEEALALIPGGGDAEHAAGGGGSARHAASPGVAGAAGGPGGSGGSGGSGVSGGSPSAARPHDHLTVEELLVYEALPLRNAAPVDKLCAVAGLGPGTVMGTLKKLQRQSLAEQRESGWRRSAAEGK